MAENQLEGETKTQTKFEKVKQWFPHMKLMAFGALFVLVLAVAGYFGFYKEKRASEEQKAVLAAEFAVVAVDPQNMVLDRDSQIKVIFNNKVTTHHVSGFIHVVPNVEGAWEQGSNDHEIIYKPKYGFYSGSRVKLTLLAGLPSDGGKKLEADYTYEFTTKLEGKDMQFSKQDKAYRAMTFNTSEGIDILAAYGDQVNEPSAVLYQAPNEQAFLQDMIYKRTQMSLPQPNEKDYKSSILYEIPEKKNVDTKTFKMLKQYNLKDNIHIKEALEPGIYVLIGSDLSGQLAHSWIFVNSTGVIFKQDDQKIVLAAQDFVTKKELSGVVVTFYRLEDKIQFTGSATIDNVLQMPYNLNNRIDMMIAKRGEEVMYVPMYMPGSAAQAIELKDMKRQLTTFITTDRPIYKPGDTVNYRGVVRVYNDNQYIVPPANTEVVFENGIGQKETKTTNNSGIFIGSFIVPANTPTYPNSPNYNSITVYDREGDYIGSGGYEVLPYIKPSFDVTVSTDKDVYTKKDKIRATIKAASLVGQPIAGREVAYRVYVRDYYETEKAVYSESFRLNDWGGMCGGGFGYWDEYYGEVVHSDVVKLDSQGQAVVEFDTASKLDAIYSQEVTVQAELKDGADNLINGARSAVVRAGEFNVFLNSKPVSVESGQEFTTSFAAETPKGDKVSNKDFEYVIYKWNYNYETQENKRSDIKRGVVRTDYRGYGYITDKIDVDTNEDYYNYNLEVSSIDSQGNRVGDSKYMNLYRVGAYRWNRTILEISSEQNNYLVGDQMALRINSPDNMRVMVSFERGRVYDPTWIDVKKGSSIYNFPVRAEYAPSISPTFTFFYKNEYALEGLTLNVPAMGKLLNIAVTSDKATYAPGETAKITIKTTDANNQPVQASVSAAVVDKAIYVLRKRANPSIHTFFYQKRFRETNSSSSMVGIHKYCDGCGGGGGGGGGDVASKLVDTLYWNPNLQTDANGVVTIEVPATEYLTTWRVVTYATTASTEVGQAEYDYMVNR